MTSPELPKRQKQLLKNNIHTIQKADKRSTEEAAASDPIKTVGAHGAQHGAREVTSARQCMGEQVWHDLHKDERRIEKLEDERQANRLDNFRR